LLVTPPPDDAPRSDAPPEGEGEGAPGGALAQAPPPSPPSLQSSEVCASSWEALWASLRACACARCVALVARTLAPPPDAPLPGVL
jgi:hypothetical protein